MGYRMMGRGHAALMLWRERLAGQAGQGTVEYVALILLVAAIMARHRGRHDEPLGGHGDRQEGDRRAQEGHRRRRRQGSPAR